MKIPERESSAGLNPTPMNPNTAGQSGRITSAIGEGLSALGDHFQSIQDSAQTTQAEVLLQGKINEAHQVAATDPDVWNVSKKTEDLLMKSVDETSKVISSASAKSLYKNKASLEISKRNVSVQNIIRTRQLSEAKNKILEFGEVKSQEFANSANDAERASIKEQFVGKVNEAVGMGIFHPDAAKAYVDTHLKGMVEGQVEHDLSIDGYATKVKEELEKGDKGIYKDISPEKRDTLIKQADKTVKYQKKQAYELHGIALNKAESDLTDKYLNHQLKPEDVVRARIGGRISKEFYDTVMKNAQNPETIGAHTDAVKYMDLLDAVHDPNNDPKELRKRIISSIGHGISNTDAKHLYSANLIVNDEGEKTNLSSAINQEKVNAKEQAISDARAQEKKLKEQNSISKAAVDLFKNWAASGKRGVQEVAEMAQDLFKSNPKPEDMLGKAVEMVNQKTLKENPSFATFPKEGKVVMKQSTGKLYLAKPDGSLVPYNGKSN